MWRVLDKKVVGQLNHYLRCHAGSTLGKALVLTPHHRFPSEHVNWKSCSGTQNIYSVKYTRHDQNVHKQNQITKLWQSPAEGLYVPDERNLKSTTFSIAVENLAKESAVYKRKKRNICFLRIYRCEHCEKRYNYYIVHQYYYFEMPQCLQSIWPNTDHNNDTRAHKN